MKKFAFNDLSRREFINMCALSTAGFLVGCASNPVTGKSQLMLVSEQEEIQMDKMYSPQQLSSDFGATQDKAMARYIQSIGRRMAPLTHRPKMPYQFYVVNATYVNAYAFPGGTIACTRGILLSLENEAELAALIGHELGHVNARHTAEIMSKNKLTSALVGGVGMIVGSYNANYGGIAAQLGMLGSGALLASYSRDNERQADDLGMKYMVKGGYSPEGMVGLMDMLQDMSKHKMSAAQLLFSTHPMSDERHKTALKTARKKYKKAKGNPVFRERYMDKIADLRKIEKGIVKIQQGDALMAKEKYPEAESHYAQALKIAKNDYAGLVKIAQSQLVQKKYQDADRNIQLAKKVYPQEAQADYLSGFIKLNRKQYAPAFSAFDAYEKKLPGNPNVAFFKGLSLEGQERIDPAAQNYKRFLQYVQEGKQAQYAYQRLVEWGYVKK
jgi:predicted Zn-dependent protease